MTYYIEDWTHLTINRREIRLAISFSQPKSDFSSFNSPLDSSTSATARLSPQLSLAVFQFLSTNVAPFKSPNISPMILQR